MVLYVLSIVVFVWFLQVLQGILDQAQEGSGAVEKQSVRAQALLMLAKVYKVCFTCFIRLDVSHKYFLKVMLCALNSWLIVCLCYLLDRS